MAKLLEINPINHIYPGFGFDQLFQVT
jgi:hypothetical protein